jgi:hypothetical protein
LGPQVGNRLRVSRGLSLLRLVPARLRGCAAFGFSGLLLFGLVRDLQVDLVEQPAHNFTAALREVVAGCRSGEISECVAWTKPASPDSTCCRLIVSLLDLDSMVDAVFSTFCFLSGGWLVIRRTVRLAKGARTRQQLRACWMLRDRRERNSLGDPLCSLRKMTGSRDWHNQSLYAPCSCSTSFGSLHNHLYAAKSVAKSCTLDRATGPRVFEPHAGLRYHCITPPPQSP